MELTQLRHSVGNNKYIFYTTNVGETLRAAALVYKNNLYLFATDAGESLDTPTYSKLVQKMKHRYGVGQVVENPDVIVTLSRIDNKTLGVEGTKTIGSNVVNYTAEILELLSS